MPAIAAQLASRARVLEAVGLCLLLGACAVGPKMGPYEAHAPRSGPNRFGVAMLPTLAVMAGRQLNERIDVALAQEGAVTNAWLNVRVLSDPQGLAVAGTFGAFLGNPEYDAAGAYVGAVMSFRQDIWSFSVAARAHFMDYTPLGLDRPDQGFLAFSDINTDGLEEYQSIEASVGLMLPSQAVARVGVRCGTDQISVTVEGIGNDVEFGCLPIIALTF